MDTTNEAPQYQALIIGTGFGGMGAAIQLKRLGIENFVMLDRNDDLGGTWHVNHYPGLAVDIASMTYSYSFEPNPNWSRLYAPGNELKAYTQHVADKYDLRRHMRFEHEVEQAVYDEQGGFWTVHLAGRAPLTARLLLTATGFLSQPKKPDIPGVNDFAGKVIHTADWDHDYDLQGKRAAVIGTGATAVQLVPAIARQLESLAVYQRTPIWVTPKVDMRIPKAVRKLFARIPLTQRAARAVSSSILETIMVTGVLYNRQLPFLTRMMEVVCKRHLAHQVKDPTLRRQLTPSYSFGCKRPTFSNTYFRTFTCDNVELVTDPIQRIEADAIITEDGRRREIDTLILATGFSLWETNFPAIRIIGKGGRDLGRWWREEGFQSYEGIALPGFPNLLSLHSPYAYNGLSYFSTIEGQMKHMERLLGAMQKEKADIFEVSREANDRFVSDMRRRVQRSVFNNGFCAPANSYYFNQHGEATLLRPTSTLAGLWRARRFPLADYRFGRSSAAGAG